MKVASIAYSKNNLSALLDEIKNGETVVITDRGKPVAQVSSVEGMLTDSRISELVGKGRVRPPRRPLNLEMLRQLSRPVGGASVLEALLEERRTGR